LAAASCSMAIFSWERVRMMDGGMGGWLVWWRRRERWKMGWRLGKGRGSLL
jgi:hypothetical protein